MPKSTKPPKSKPKPKPTNRGRIRWRSELPELPELIDPKWPAAIALADELYGDL